MSPGAQVELPPAIVLYDGVCGLCSLAVRWLLVHDRERRLRFAPLQGETAALLRARHPEIPLDLDSVVLIDEGRVFLRSRAFLYVSRHLTWPWRWGWWFRWVPATLLDVAYGLLARVRYRVFGKFESCRLPDPEERARLLP